MTTYYIVRKRLSCHKHNNLWFSLRNNIGYFMKTYTRYEYFIATGLPGLIQIGIQHSYNVLTSNSWFFPYLEVDFGW